MSDYRELYEAEDHARFMAELTEISPESFTLDELRAILDEMVESKVAIEDNVREDFAKLDKVRQTRLLDSLGASGSATATGGTARSWTAPCTTTVRSSDGRTPPQR